MKFQTSLYSSLLCDSVAQAVAQNACTVTYVGICMFCLCMRLCVCLCMRVDVVCIIKFVYRTCVERRLTVKTFGNEEIAYLYCYLCCCVCFLPDIFIGVSFLIMRRVCV